MRVFLSHSSRDKPAVEALARHLRAQGIDAWFDQWEIAPGDDIIARMNEGLEQADAGLIVFSAQSLQSPWVKAEVSSLTYERIKHGQPLIPVQAGDDAYIPPLLRPLCRLALEDHEGIAAALLHRRAGPPPLGSPSLGRQERVRLQLERRGDGGVVVRAAVADKGTFEAEHPELPAAVREGRALFLRGFGAGVRDWASTGRATLEAELLALGQALAAFCLPAGAAEALAQLLNVAPVGTTVLVEIEAVDPELLGLPFEALRLPNGRLLAIEPPVVLQRRLPALPSLPPAPLAGPLKVLVAVGAPDEGLTRSAVLDHERELQNILDAVEPAQRLDNVAVKILEVGNPEQIAAAIAVDAYHVLHLSCHGTPGTLQLEDELGAAVLTTAEDLVAPLRATGRPLPLVVLNSCHGGVEMWEESGSVASLAQALIQAGIPSVVAMQTTVSDRYASELARHFYAELSRREPVLAGRALAAARRELERERQRRLDHGAPAAETLPEAATAALYVAGEEQPLADFGLDKQPLRQPPVRQLLGPVPQLAIGDLVGRRRELRACLRRLRDAKAPGGVLLSGIGGVGKSSVAGRLMQRLAEEGWLIACHSGRFDLREIGVKVGLALHLGGHPHTRPLADLLLRNDLDERLRPQLLQQLLRQESLLLVLDDFEQNLSTGGGAFLDPDTVSTLALLLASADRGALLLTCRHPLPQAMEWLLEVPVGPLHGAETRKLVQRLPGLCQRPEGELAAAIRAIGGHPRLLEFLDGLLRQGEGRLPAVTQRLRQALAAADLAAPAAGASLHEGLQQALALGARDVLLEELLAIARQRDDDAVLLQLAVSNLPLPPAGLARMLAGEVEETAVEPALARLTALSLVVRGEDGQVWMHRWTAEGLAALVEVARHGERYRRAGDYRIWRAENESQALEDGIEAVRNYLQGGHFDQAAGVAQGCLAALNRLGQTVAIATLAAEVLERLPPEHSRFAGIADAEARAHQALGDSNRAFARYQQLLEIAERLAKAEPDRADYQLDLVISLVKIGTAAAGRSMLEQALVILLRLDLQGRLAPADQPKIEALRQMLGD